MLNIGEVDPLTESLLAVASFYNIPATREMLVSGLPLPDNRLTPKLFGRAAARIGLSSRLVKKSLSQLHDALLPAVLILQENHTCFFLGWTESGEKARIQFPELSGTVSEISKEELLNRYSGIVILIRPKQRFDARTTPLSQDKGGHWFWEAMRANIPVYRDVLLAAFLVNLFALALPLFTMNVYDRVVPNHAIETLWMLASGVIIVLLGDLVLRTIRGYFVDLASRRVDMELSSRIMEKVLGIRLEVKPLSVGSFASNLRSYETVRDFITSASLLAIIDLPFVLVFLGVIAWISWPLVFPLLIGVIIVGIYAWYSAGRMLALAETTYRASAERNAVLIESLVGLETLKSMGAESLMQRRWEKTSAFLAHTGIKLKLLSLANMNVTQFVQQLISVVVIIIGVYLISNGSLSMGGLIACSMITGRALAPLAQVSGLLASYHTAKTSLAGLEEIMKMPVERPLGKNYLSRKTFSGTITFNKVSFVYPSAKMESLRDVSFTIKPGEHVAILGRVGSGKSTLQKLAMGLFQPTSGAILIDGIDLRQLDPAEVRQHIGYVPQETTLFYGSLRENMVLTHPQAGDQEIIEAAEFACLSEFVNNHPMGFDMQVGERGEALSGGQRNCVGLARAVIHAPPILLMDEPTGSMDHSTEEWIKQKIAQFMKGRTVITVTHRTSLLDLADRIIVMDKGIIVADGPKSQVIEALRQGRIGKAS